MEEETIILLLFFPPILCFEMRFVRKRMGDENEDEEVHPSGGNLFTRERKERERE